jgi:protein TonB
MHFMREEAFGTGEEIAVVRADLFPYGILPSALAMSRYGDSRRRPNWLAIGLILLLHAGALLMLATLDIIVLPPAKRDPMVVTLIPEMVPPPAVKLQPLPQKPPDQPQPVDITNVVVPTPVPAFVAPEPPRAVAPVPVAVAAPPAPAPILPPDVDAATAARSPPVYPVESRRRREQGTVRLRVIITPEGRVKEVAVASSSGFDRLDQAALDAVRHWRFRPGTQAGLAVEAVGFLSIPFKLT